MKTRLLCLVVLGASLVLASGCRSPYYAERGAGFGALTGGLAGAAIGEKSDNTLAGAAIGTAVGALTGAKVGQSIDEDIARSQVEIERQMGRRMQGLVTVADVISMTEAGLSDSVITTHIRANGVAQRPTAEDLVTLSKAGVTEQTIMALQQAEVPTYHPSPVPVGPVIVEEHHYGPPVFIRGHDYRHPRHFGRHHVPNGVRWGISVGH